MSSSNSSALTKRSASTALMAPPPAPKRIKRPTTVLDEDTYTSAISHIIRRDFFPGLAETDAQREYLNALESKNNQWIREAGEKLTTVMTPVGGRARNTRFGAECPARADLGRGKTPSTWGKDTPRTEAGGDEGGDESEDGLGRLDKVDLDMSLGAFQAKYTSEDQESFNKILDAQNRKTFEKNEWLRSGNRFASKQRIAQQKVLEARASTSSSTEITLRPSQNLDDRPAAPNTHKHVPFNTLMFPPESIDNRGLQTRAQDAEAASLAPPKRVLHVNTRLPTLTNDEPSQPPSPTISAVRDAIAGNPRLTASEGGYTGSETPRVNGYAFVDALPPEPDSEEEQPAPTNLLEKFGAKGSSSAPFKISESLPREKLHHKMVDKISASKRSGNSAPTSASMSSSSSLEMGRKLGLFTSATPRFMSAPTPGAGRLAQGGMTPGGKQMGGLTPAGKRLFQSMGGGTPRTGGDAAGGFGEGRQWTPTPRVKRKT